MKAFYLLRHPKSDRITIAKISGIWILLLLTFTFGSCRETHKTKTDSLEPIPENVERGTQSGYADKGMGYAMATQATLGKSLVRTISEKGTIGAIQFCNTRALPITDSLSNLKNAHIKRVSDRPRNPINQANKEELGHISRFKEQMASNIDPKPIVIAKNGEIDFYFPITTNAMCLQCHGKHNEQVAPETLTSLKNLYPSDEAVGYGVNEVRGMWAIHFQGKN